MHGADQIPIFHIAGELLDFPCSSSKSMKDIFCFISVHHSHPPCFDPPVTFSGRFYVSSCAVHRDNRTEYRVRTTPEAWGIDPPAKDG